MDVTVAVDDDAVVDVAAADVEDLDVVADVELLDVEVVDVAAAEFVVSPGPVGYYLNKEQIPRVDVSIALRLLH